MAMSVEQFFMVDSVANDRKDVIISERFKDDKGELVPWTIRKMSANESKVLKVKHTKKGILDQDSYASDMIAECVVSPDLYNQALQDHYKVCTPQGLLDKMLTMGEYALLSEAIAEFNGYNKDLADKVKEIKNG